MGCDIGSFKTKYLGLPLGAKFKVVHIWSEVIEREKAVTWRMQYLAMFKRLTLLKSVLDSIPMHIMSLFPMPSKVQNQIDKIRRSFLWKVNYKPISSIL